MKKLELHQMAKIEGGHLVYRECWSPINFLGWPGLITWAVTSIINCSRSRSDKTVALPSPHP